jgi:hypothetical protein
MANVQEKTKNILKKNEQQTQMTIRCLMHKARATKLALAKYGVR